MNKLQLLGIKNNLKVLSLKRDYERKYEDYKIFLANKKSVIKVLNEEENQITKNKDNEIAFSVGIYIIAFFLNIIGFISLFNILGISTMLNAIITSIILNIGVLAPILLKKINLITKKEQIMRKTIGEAKEQLIIEQNNLQDALVKSLNKYSVAKEKNNGPKIKPTRKIKEYKQKKIKKLYLIS